MKIFVLVGFVALLAYASAQCGCLKCSKHLTVIGRTIPVNNCPPTTVICRGPPTQRGGQSLPIRIQAPIPTAPVSVPLIPSGSDLRYKIVNTSPCGIKVSEQPLGVGIKYDTRIEVPVPVPVSAPTTVTSTNVNLKPCVDRIVIPAPAGGCGPGINQVYNEQVYTNPTGGYQADIPIYANPTPSCGSAVDTPIYVNPIRDTPVYVNPIRDNPVYVNPIRDNPVYVNPIRGCGEVFINPISPPVYANTIRETVGPVCQSEGGPVHVPSGPVLDCSVSKKIVSRYGHPVQPFLESPTQVDSNNLVVKDVRHRCKREVPFLRHGYKFMMNMLPEFVQQPIKSTVNDLALMHPDQRLQRVYNQPPKLTLKEKLQMQREKNMEFVRNKLRQRSIKNSIIRKPYNTFPVDRRDPSAFLYNTGDQYKYQQYQWPQQFSSRSNTVDPSQYLDNEYLQDYLNSLKERDDTDKSIYPVYSRFGNARNLKQGRSADILESTNTVPRNPKLIELEKALLTRKLKNLNDELSRAKRSTVFEKYWLQKNKRPPSGKRLPNLFDTSDVVLPFYHVKEESSEEDSSSTYRDEYLQSFPQLGSENSRYRREGDVYNFLEPYNFNHVAAENHNIREDFLRHVIREELKKRFQNEEKPKNDVEPFSIESRLSKSPILNVMTFPVRLIKQFGDATKQAFPEVESLPKMLTGAKKYFTNFGRNFRKNVLHLTSDLIGDFDNLEIPRNMFGPPRQRRSAGKTIDVEYDEDDPKNIQLKVSIPHRYEPDYSLAFGDEYQDAPEGKKRIKRYIMKMVDEDEIEEYLMEKLGDIFVDPAMSTNVESIPKASTPHYWQKQSGIDEEESQKKLVLEQLKPKIILDNNGKPFLEINGYKRPLLRPANLSGRKDRKKLRPESSFRSMRYYDSSEEADSERISSLISHAKRHVENNFNPKFPEMPIKTIKEKISQLLFETDMLVHMDFNKYDDIYDDLIALQHMKTSIVQDWKRLIMSKAINTISAKIALLERFKELQHYKDLTLTSVVSSLVEDNENVFISKKLIKMLVRLQKLQCLINQVVTNFHDHLHISSKSETEKEIKYVDFLSGLNFVLEKSRNDMINNLKKDRDAALQRNIILLDKLKKLLMYETDSYKLEQEAELLWEMKNIQKMQRTAIEDMKRRLDAGYKVKRELRILFDLLKRYETCEMNQRRLLSKFERQGSSEKEEVDEEESSEEVVMTKNIKVVPREKLNLEELRAKWQERLRKRRILLKKKLNMNSRRFRKKSEESDEEN